MFVRRGSFRQRSLRQFYFDLFLSSAPKLVKIVKGSHESKADLTMVCRWTHKVQSMRSCLRPSYNDTKKQRKMKTVQPAVRNTSEFVVTSDCSFASRHVWSSCVLSKEDRQTKGFLCAMRMLRMLEMPTVVPSPFFYIGEAGSTTTKVITPPAWILH